MALELITSNQTITYTFDDNDDVVVAEGVRVSDTSDAIRANTGAGGNINNTLVSVFGSVIGGDDGIDLFISPTNVIDAQIFVGAQGSVMGVDAGIALEDPTGVEIVNNGQIYGGNIGILSDDTDGYYSIANSGTITGGGNSAIKALSGSGTFHVTNSGTLSGLGADAAATVFSAAQLILANSGEIVAQRDFAVQTDGSFVDRVENSGVIRGEIELDSGNDVVINAGTILGDVGLNDDNDIYDGGTSGVVTGTVSGGNGDDTLRGSDGVDLLNGGNDNDVISGRGGDDVIDAGNGDDVVVGGEGNDSILAGFNNDTVNGNAGDDTIDGGFSDDVLRGGRDDDLIMGSFGDDNMRGDSGDDVLVGGDGRDDMFGGSGNDVFLFEDTSESGTGSVRDRIYDFRSGEDALDISQLVGPVLSYIGSSNFSGTGGREVRTVELTNGTIVYIDTNGDGARDSDIYLIGTFGVTEGDFLL